MARLREYERKRSKGETPEPFGGRGRSGRPVFVVQRHDARRLHYDFRLERDGALASWAVPKGIPLEPGQRHLAVHVEDHPLDYAAFEGEIPAGQYGAGTVEIWDRGTYELVEEKPDGGLTVRLAGERLQGLWTLVPAKLDGDERNWLLLRKQDKGSPSAGSRRAYEPMLATLADEVPTGSEWLHEVKWDGYRAIGLVAGGEASLTSRRGNDLTERFATVARALGRAVRTPDCVLDGEVCALDEEGRSSFSVMQQGSGPLVYYVFDVLEIDGEPVVELPLTERRELLAGLLDLRGGTIRLSDAFDDGEALFEAARAQGLEGVLAKKRGSRYQPGRRTRDWLKVKTHLEQEFVVAGYTRGKGRRAAGFGALILAVVQGREARVRRQRRHGVHGSRDREGSGRSFGRSSATSRRSPRSRRCRRCGVTTSSGSSRSWWPRSPSPSGRTTGVCAPRCTKGCARTRIRKTCVVKSRSLQRSAAASGS